MDTRILKYFLAVAREENIGYAIVIEGLLPYIDKNIICMRPLYPEKPPHR